MHSKRGAHGTKTVRRWLLAAVFLATILAIAYAGRPTNPPKHAGESRSVREQAAQFISYDHSIHLSPAQEKTKSQALRGIGAPCCSNYSIETCCCPCNLAKSVWGLSKHLIAEKGYDADQVRAGVQEWLRTANPRGFSGVACFKGGCRRPFHEDGCGGMNEAKIS